MRFRASDVVGADDVSFFPEIPDERSSYASPLTDILNDLRRKHVVAAAATTGPHMSLQDSEDNGDSSNTEICTCRAQSREAVQLGSSRRRTSSLFGGGAFGRVDSMKTLKLEETASGVCSVCGKKGQFDPIGDFVLASGKNRFDRRASVDATRQPSVSALGPPAHAKALLQSTPHFRHLSPTSMDMQGIGNTSSSRGIFGLVLPASKPTAVASTKAAEPGQILDYRTCLVRDKSNQQAAAELSSFLWVLAHEMSLEAYLDVENGLFTSIFALVHAHDTAKRMAGVAALDALMDTPSADEEKKAIKFAGALSSGLRAPQADYNFLSAVAEALGKLARRAANVDSVEAEVVRALEWLRMERSDRRLAACLILKELAMNSPTAFYSKTTSLRVGETSVGHGGSSEFLEYIFPVIRDPQPIVRACAADALSQCLKILLERMQISLTGALCKVYSAMMEGLNSYDSSKTKKGQSSQATQKAEAAQHGSLLVLACMIHYTGEFMLPRFDEVCTAVMKFTEHPKALVQLEVIRLIPRLAHRCPRVFGRRDYLEESLVFLMKSASSPTQPRVGLDFRPSAYTALGQFILAMKDPETGTVIGAEALPTMKIRKNLNRKDSEPIHTIEVGKTGIIYDKLAGVFGLVRLGLRRPRPGSSTRGISTDTRNAALNCGADLVEALGPTADPYILALINDIFESGLSEDLIHCLHAIAVSVPSQQALIEDRLLQEVSLCLAGTPSAAAICNPLFAFKAAMASLDNSPVSPSLGTSATQTTEAAAKDEAPRVEINMSNRPEEITKLILSLFTLGSFGDDDGKVTTSGTVVPLLPFVHRVAAKYLSHPSSRVRRAASLTCCTLLVSPGSGDASSASSSIAQQVSPYAVLCGTLGTASGHVIEDVLRELLQVAVSDPSPVVRLCVVRALDSRYDPFLCQPHHVQALLLLLQDEALATRAAGLKLLGRLTRFNPAPVLPVMRRFLVELVIAMRCGGDKRRSREEATRLLNAFLRAESFHRLVHPVLSSIVDGLPLTGVSPRLASAGLEALGELAKAAGVSLKPWIKELVPHILETMQDQSSASKQLISLRSLGQIAGSTGYVIRPYRDFPQLLARAADVLPGTKRAPWALRREAIRTLGILGALDPDQYHTFVPTTRKGGGVGGGYFIEDDDIAGTRRDSTGSRGQSDSDARTATELSKSRTGQSQGASDLSIPGSSNRARTANLLLETGRNAKETDDDMPAHAYMYEQYAMVAQPVFHIPSERRMTPAEEEFYPTVTIQALTRIFQDSSLAVHHGMVLQAIMFIFKSLGLRCVPYLKKVVPHMIYTVRTCNPSTLREALLKELATLSGIVNEHLRPYVADIFDVLDDFWSTRHLGAILNLISKIAVGVPDEFRKYVPRFVQKLLATLAEIQASDWLMPHSRNEVAGSASLEVEKLELILRSVRNLREVLAEHLHIIVPALLKLAESLVAPSASATGGNGVTPSTLTDVAVLTLQTLSALLGTDNVRSMTAGSPIPGSWNEFDAGPFPSGDSLAARATQPLIRLLGDKANANKVVGLEIITVICVCASRLGYRRWKSLYHDVARDAICHWHARIGLDNTGIAAASTSTTSSSVHSASRAPTGLPLYDEVVQSLETSFTRKPSLSSWIAINSSRRISQSGRQDSFIATRNPMESALAGISETFYDPLDPSAQPALVRGQVNQGNLQRAWDVSQLASREDWDEWMRRLAIQLLREAPSPALRATAGLAHAYQPLARELFSAAFVCCWEELNEQYRANLVFSLESAFVADVSPEILQTLLNLAEFMEHEGVENGLPIDTSILADLSLKCRAFAKALHYKEREYNNGDASASCVEVLISTNNKLDLPEAALGVLKAARIHHDNSRLDYAHSVNSEFEPPTGGESLYSQVRRDYLTSGMRYSVLAMTDDTFAGGDIEPWGFFQVHQESWLAKLGSWSDALVVYEDKLSQNPFDFDAILGSMRCHDANGEWQQVLNLAGRSWLAISGELGRTDAAPHSFSSLYITPKARRKALKFCAQAAWRMGQWEELEKYASQLVLGTHSPVSNPTLPVNAMSKTGGSIPPLVDFDGAFYTAVLHIHRREWSLAEEAIDAARMAMDSRFTALMAESYKRAYSSMVTAQTLAEMEEIITYRKLEERAHKGAHRHPANCPNAAEARKRLLKTWGDRLQGCRVDADVHASILAVRSLVLSPTDAVDGILTLSDLSRQVKRFKLAERVLLDPLTELGADLEGSVFGFGLPDALELGLVHGNFDNPHTNGHLIERLITEDARMFQPKYGAAHERYSKILVKEAGGLEKLTIQHRLYFAYVKHLWATDKREEAMHRLSRLSGVVDLVSNCEEGQDNSLRVGCWLELGEWNLDNAMTPNSSIPDALQVDVLGAFKRAISSPSAAGYRAWHAWALLNFRIAQQLDDERAAWHEQSPSRSIRNHVVVAVKGFVNAISVGTKRWSASVQQDMLNLLTCLFKYGELSGVATSINEGLNTITLEAWLGVLPQLLARIHIRTPSVRSVLHPLLVRLGERHPQALMYPLSVLIKSPVVERKVAAESLMNSLKGHSSALVEEALMVSSELIRVAILWLETWHGALDDASRLYFVEGNVSGMLDLLLPLHEKIERGGETRREKEFLRSFGDDLAEAHAYAKDYVNILARNGVAVPSQGGAESSNQYDPSCSIPQAEIAMNKAWDIYYTVFRRINQQLPSLTKLELSHCSPALSRAHNLELGIPGSYRVDGSYTKIERFVPKVQVITSKQRPRKICLRGSDGNEYVYVLKGHEDLRQDERVMQLFGLVNALLARDRQTKKLSLNIQRYAISPLSHDCGLVGWVPHCDTFHSLVRDYRQAKKIPLNMENREMLKMAPDYEFLTVMQKVEVFTEGLRRSVGKGNDLYEILWLQSTNSEEWLERRTKYTRSLAVMSMVGYILGLGDRHPSNLMLDQLSGRILHIDFGDCFEVAMNREKFPEKIPFRLTRMLVKAMEVSGIEGSYRSTCERTMTVLRENRDSLVAMLEAFVYDPLISWRLVGLGSGGDASGQPSKAKNLDSASNDGAESVPKVPPTPTAVGASVLHESIAEEVDEDSEEPDEHTPRAPGRFGSLARASLSERLNASKSLQRNIDSNVAASASRAKSLKIYSDMQAELAESTATSRIASVTAEQSGFAAAEGSMAKSRMARSLQQREVMSLLEGESATAHEESLNENALKVIRRVRDKLSGTDFEVDDLGEPLDVPDQVGRLIIQATSTENLCQLFIGMCAFW